MPSKVRLANDVTQSKINTSYLKMSIKFKTKMSKSIITDNGLRISKVNNITVVEKIPGYQNTTVIESGKTDGVPWAFTIIYSVVGIAILSGLAVALYCIIRARRLLAQST